MRSRYAMGVSAFTAVISGVFATHSAGGASTVPADPLPLCEEVFVDGGAPTLDDYERGCIVTFEPFECEYDGSTRFRSMIGNGRVDGNFFSHTYTEVAVDIEEYCNRTPDESDDDFANFILSMCITDTSPADAMVMAADEGFSEGEMAILERMVAACP